MDDFRALVGVIQRFAELGQVALQFRRLENQVRFCARRCESVSPSIYSMEMQAAS